jgi:para-aminobenzoate synthetase/4-amino-4-deoxychorismate lyase
MQIINEVETGPRGIYCGSIGHAAPNGDFSFNVAIRTARIGPNGEGEIGIGGGVVADSRLEAEYDEALLKLKFFKENHMPLGLIETLRWDEHGFYLLERHLERLETSAAFFEIPYDSAKARTALEEAVGQAVEPEAQRVRLVLDESGKMTAKAATLAAMHRLRFVIADRRMDSANRLLVHKTTQRAIYDEPREQAIRDFGVDEVVFINERGELTEGSFTNLFVQKGDGLLTPSLSCGLLPGCLRAELIADGKVKEAVLTVADLESAEKVFLGNSVRGLVEAHWQKEG